MQRWLADCWLRWQEQGGSVVRVVVIDRGEHARSFVDGHWVFSGNEEGRGVRIWITHDDWRCIRRCTDDDDAAIDQLERFAALSDEIVEDGYGGYSIVVSGITPVDCDRCEATRLRRT